MELIALSVLSAKTYSSTGVEPFSTGFVLMRPTQRRHANRKFQSATENKQTCVGTDFHGRVGLDWRKVHRDSQFETTTRRQRNIFLFT